MEEAIFPKYQEIASNIPGQKSNCVKKSQKSKQLSTKVGKNVVQK